MYVPMLLDSWLQRVPNLAACFVTRTKTQDHITPVLRFRYAEPLYTVSVGSKAMLLRSQPHSHCVKYIY